MRFERSMPSPGAGDVTLRVWRISAAPEEAADAAATRRRRPPGASVVALGIPVVDCPRVVVTAVGAMDVVGLGVVVGWRSAHSWVAFSSVPVLSIRRSSSMVALMASEGKPKDR
jgi:hypothetical protein